MKRTYTMVEDDQQGQQGKGTLSRQGVRGDTQLAHVNPWEQALLRALGGAGTINPQTGLRQFYTDPYSTTPIAPTEQLPFLDFPLDIKPYSEHTESSYTGLPESYGQSLLQSLMPQLLSSIADMPGNIDIYTGQALGSYQQMMQDALRKNIPSAIGNLANRGVISSTEGQRALSDVYSSAAIDAANKGYQTAMQAALLKANIPSVLAQIGELGKVTTSTGMTYEEDPTQMYSIVADLIRSMM